MSTPTPAQQPNLWSKVLPLLTGWVGQTITFLTALAALLTASVTAANQGGSTGTTPTASTSPVASAPVSSPPPVSSSAPASSPPASPTPTASPSPSPSPSSTATAVAGGCMVKPSACGFPDDTNTGVPAGTTLTPHPGSQKITVAGTVIDGWDTGRINIAAANVVIKNSRITTSSYFGVYVYSGSVTVEDTTIIGVDTSDTARCDVGVNGAVLVERVNVGGCSDGAHVSGSDVVKDSYFHDFYFTATTHNDGIQTSNGNGLVLDHNTILMVPAGLASPAPGAKWGNSCIFLQPLSAAINGADVSSNLLNGGGYTIYVEQSTAVTADDNRLGAHNYGWLGTSHTTVKPEHHGNVDDATGKALD